MSHPEPDSIHPVTPSRALVDQEIRAIEHEVLSMASVADAMIADAVRALSTLDTPLATEVIQRDDVIDHADLDIEVRCLRLLVLHQPLASDFRTVGTVLKMVTDLERVGDLAVDIAKIARKIDLDHGSSEMIDIRRIAGLAARMLRDAIEAFVKRDIDLAHRVCVMDDDVDDLYRAFREQLHEAMKSKPHTVVSASYLLLAIHHFERIADHAVNIAERVAFMVTGRFEQLASSHRSDS